MERNHERAKDKTTMTVSIERQLLHRIDALAKKDRRNRSNWVVSELEKRVAILESFSVAGEKPLADAGGPSSPSTSRDTRANSVNEDSAETGPSQQAPPPAPRMTRTRAALKDMAKREGKK